MSEEAKKARAAMKAKAKRLASAGSEKVDSSDWKQAEPLNADVKTGMRPLSRRQFKEGGKAEGPVSKKNAGRKARKSGGKVYADALVNRNVKEANEEREGKKHIGGMKTGGRAQRASGGKLKDWEARALFDKYNASKQAESEQKLREKQKAEKVNQSLTSSGLKSGGRAKKKFGGEMGDVLSVLSPAFMAAKMMRGDDDDKKARGGRTKREDGGKIPVPPRRKDVFPEEQKPESKPDPSKQLPGDHVTNASGYSPRKGGGRAKKMGGGAMPMPMGDPRLAMVKDKSMEFAGNPVTPGLKKGGKVKHDDEKADKALIKKMVKPSARTGKSAGGDIDDKPAKYLGAGRKGDKSVKDAEKEYGEREEWETRADNRIKNEFSPAAMRKMRAERAIRMAADKGLQEFTERRKKKLDADSMDKAGYKSGGRSKRATGGMIAETKKQAALKADPHNQTKIKPQQPQQPEEKACGGRSKRKSGGRIAKFGGGGLALMGGKGAGPGAANPMGGGRGFGGFGVMGGGNRFGAQVPQNPLMAGNGMPNQQVPQGIMGGPAGLGSMPVGANAQQPPLPSYLNSITPPAGNSGFPDPRLQGSPPPGIGIANGLIPIQRNTGGRVARKSGGKTKAKGKTNINIVISGAGGAPKPQGGMPMPMPAPDAGPAAQAPMPQGGPPPQGMDPAMMAMLMQQQQPPGQPPMPRKSGGRVTKVAKSYKDMEAGSASGEGRLQKTDIAKRTNAAKKEDGEKTFTGKGYPNKVPGATGGRTARKAGGMVHMNAGAGSGEGRLEKTARAKRMK